MGEQIRIGELSRQTGCNIETIRYYERIGVLPAPPRTAAGYRLYGLEHLRRLHFIRRARELGFSLDEVRGLLSLAESGRYTCGEIQALGLEHLQEVRRKIADLRRLEAVLDELTHQCQGGSTPVCPILDALWAVSA
jgi:MerR family mercuric resistance operon transcriptional regulator